MKKIIFIFLSILLICSISACNSTMPELPEGYKLLCSSEGKYCLQFPDGDKSVSVWVSKRKAIRFAIHWEQVKDIPYTIESDKYTWSVCPIFEDSDKSEIVFEEIDCIEETIVIGILFEAPKGTNREEFILDFLDSIEIVGGEATEPFCTIENPCGEKYIIQNKKDFPLDKDIPCTCGNKNHFFIKYEESE